jgi:hypothetical protein
MAGGQHGDTQSGYPISTAKTGTRKAAESSSRNRSYRRTTSGTTRELRLWKRARKFSHHQGIGSFSFQKPSASKSIGQNRRKPGYAGLLLE